MSKTASATGPVDSRLDDWFIDGIEAEDVAGLRPLMQARVAIDALVTLFHGTDDAVLIRLLVLRELARRSGDPHFSASELRQQFPYLDQGKLENLIGRLRVNGILAWDAEISRYSISPIGRMLIASVANLLKFNDEGSELGYLAGQLAAGSAVGGISAEDLQHLLARLTELKDRFERAILSGSESRIREAARELDKVWRNVDRGSDILKAITAAGELDSASHRVAQRIGQVQSELLRMSGAFQRALSKLESQKVHLGATGLSSTDIAAWLRSRTQAQLCDLLMDAVAPGPSFAFTLGDIALDVAEFELIDRLRAERIDAPLPPPLEAVSEEAAQTPPPDYAEVERWLDTLRNAPDGCGLAEAVPLRDYELSSYRLALLSLLGDRQSSEIEGPVAELAQLDRRVEWTGGSVAVARHGVEEMSEGRLRGGETVDGV